MAALDLIYLLLAGGLLGMLGQVVRMCAGLKKASDSAAASGQSFADMFDGGKLGISLVIGFAAGALALLGAGWGSTSGPAGFKLDNSTISAIIAAGYAGTDFIEAFMKKSLPDSSGAAAGPAARQPPMG